MLSAALRASSTGSLHALANSPLSVLTYSASTSNVADIEENFEEDLLFGDGDEQPSSPTALDVAGDGETHQLQHRALQQAKQHLLHHSQQQQQQLQQQQHRQQPQAIHRSTTFPATAAWDVPARSDSITAAAAAAMASGTAGMAQSLPRPISGQRLVRLAGRGGDGSDDEDGFVPPHLAASLAEPQLCMSRSMATKGVAALRIRSKTLYRTGYMDGNIGAGAAAPAVAAGGLSSARTS